MDAMEQEREAGSLCGTEWSANGSGDFRHNIPNRLCPNESLVKELRRE